MPRIAKLDGILISVTGYRWNPGTRKIREDLGHADYMRFLAYIADLLQKEFVKAINTQRYRKDIKKWPPLTINYVRYKMKRKLSTNIWEATGNLKRNIKVFRRGSWLVVGFKQNDRYPKTNLQINKVAKYVEYGGVRMPPRPLFRSITERIRKDISRYYKKFLRDILKRK